jgi:hypothetical protein
MVSNITKSVTHAAGSGAKRSALPRWRAMTSLKLLKIDYPHGVRDAV